MEGLRSVGVCFSGLGNNLPSDQETVELYKSNGINRMRIYAPGQSILEALRGSKIGLIMDVGNHDLQSLGTNSSAADWWVQNFVLNYYPDVDIKYIVVGNELNPDEGDTAWLTQYVLPAMESIYNAIVVAGLQDKIKVSTATYMPLVSNTYPPSQGSFEGKSKSFIEPILSFLVRTNAPLLVNIHPYISYIGNTLNIQLSYALLSSSEVTMWDGSLGYTNLFDAMLDACYSALEKSGSPQVEIVVSESGWPSDGGWAATMDNASTYVKNLTNHVNKGTPKRPSKGIETYIFAIYEENQKNGEETEKHYGLFYADKKPKYLQCIDSIGVCNGGVGNNLPSDQETVQLYKSSGITKMRIYGPNQSTLQALRGSNIGLIMDVGNFDLQALGTNPSAANWWVQNNVLNYYPDVNIRYIAVGNEVNPNEGDTTWMTQYVYPAMENIYGAITAAGLQGKIKVSTATYMPLVSNTFPPSHGSFEGNSKRFLEPIISFLNRTNAPLLVNIYTYFAYIGNPREISLPYSLLSSNEVLVRDGSLGYTNLFDAMLDTFYAALEKSGGSGIEIVVSESGWPSDGGFAASMDNASTYLRNLVQHVKKGSPKRPSKRIETYIFAMYEENLKNGAETEKHFGVFYPDKRPKYNLTFN